MLAEGLVYVVEDDYAVNQLFVRTVEALGLGAVSCSDGEAFWTALDRSTPGCVLADIGLPGMSGLEILSRLQSEQTPIPVILITGYASIPLCVSAMQRGACGFLEKPPAFDALRAAIQRAMTLSRITLEQAAERDSTTAIASPAPSQLTSEDRVILDLLVAGKANKQIAARLDVSVRTVQFRVTKLMRKLGAESRTALVHQLLHGSATETRIRIDAAGVSSLLPQHAAAAPRPDAIRATRPAADRPWSS